MLVTVKFFRNKTLFFSKLFLLPLAFFAWSLFSLAWTEDLGSSYIQLPQLLSSLLILFIAMQITEYKHQQLVVQAAIAGCVFAVLIGILQAYNINPFNIHFRNIPASTFTNPNHASLYIEFFIPVLLILLIYTDNSRLKIAYSTTLTLVIFYVSMLSSFGTMIAVSLAIVFSFFILSKFSNIIVYFSKSRYYLLGIVSCSLILVLTYTPSNLKPSETDNKSFATSVQKNSHIKRATVYAGIWEAIKDKPVSGFGYGGFRAGILPYIAATQPTTKHNEYKYYQEAHSDFLQQYAETGIFAGTVFIIFNISILYLGLNSLKNKPITEKNILIFSLSAGLLATSLHGFIDFPYHLPASSMIIYLASGLILSMSAKKVVFTSSNRLTLSTSLVLSIVFLFFIFTSYYSYKHIVSSKLARDALIALHGNNNCEDAVYSTDKSSSEFQYVFHSQIIQAIIYRNCPQPLEKQVQVVQNLVSLNPTNFNARYLRGNILLLNNNPLAIEEYYYIIKMLPGRALGYNGMAKFSIKKGDFKSAQTYLDTAMLVQPGNPETRYILEQLKKLKK